MNITIYTKSQGEINLMNISEGARKIFEEWFADDLKWPVITVDGDNNSKVGINRNEISYYKVWYDYA